MIEAKSFAKHAGRQRNANIQHLVARSVPSNGLASQVTGSEHLTQPQPSCSTIRVCGDQPSEGDRLLTSTV
jgi:hypothetical protein